MSNKINVWNLTRADDPVHDIEVLSNDGEVFKFQLKRLGTVGITAAHDRAAALAAQYCESEDNPEPEAFPAVSGRMVKVTESSFLAAALLETAQAGEARYTAEEFVVLSIVREEVFAGVNREAVKLGIFGATKAVDPTKREESSPDTSG